VSPPTLGLQFAEESSGPNPANHLAVRRFPNVLTVRGGHHQIEAIPLSAGGGAAEDPPIHDDLVPIALGSSGFDFGAGWEGDQRNAIRLLAKAGVSRDLAQVLGVERGREQ
jgi:hypothetical protein